MSNAAFSDDDRTVVYSNAQGRRRSVLVAVVNNADDMRRAASEGWYRIPQRRAPRRVGADYLAFYQTGAFEGEPEAQTVTFYAPTRRYRLLTRAELFPQEANHPRADDFYFRIDIGQLQRLERPVVAGSFRRVTFIHTTLDRLFTAHQVTDLFYQEDPFDRLWHALREHRLRPLRNRIVGERPVDITLRARGGYLGICCTGDDETPNLREQYCTPQSERWQLLHLPLARLETDLNGCLRAIGAALIHLGGSVLNIES